MLRKHTWLVTVMAITLVLGLVVTGCGTTQPTTATNGTAAPAPAKEMKFSFNPGAEPKTLDPQMSNGLPEGVMEIELLEGLERLDKDSNPQDAIAQSITVSPDQLTWTIKMKDTKWSNGDPLTAEDFQAAWMHALDPAAAAEYAYQLFYIKNGEAYNGGKAKAEDVGIKVIDPLTIQITLEAPTPYFKSLLAFPTYLPVNKKVVAANKNWNTSAETYVGNGPFKMQSWAHNDKMVLVKNPNYWDAKNVKITELTFNLVEDGKAALTAFEAGQLDGTDNIPVADVTRLKQSGVLKTAPMAGTYYYKFNVTKKPFDDPRVRQALSMAIDRKAIVTNVTKGGQLPALSFVAPGIADSTPGKTFRDVGGDYFKEDVAAAKKLLADAGYPDGKGFPKTEILYNSGASHEVIAQAIQDMWQKNLGISIGLKGQEWAVYQASEQKLQYDVARAGWIADYSDPMTWMDMFVTNGGNNQTGWSNKVYDDAIATAKKTGDQKVRMEQMHIAEKALMTEMPVMPIYYYVNNYVMKDYVKGAFFTPLGFIDFKTATVEK